MATIWIIRLRMRAHNNHYKLSSSKKYSEGTVWIVHSKYKGGCSIKYVDIAISLVISMISYVTIIARWIIFF